MADSESRGLWFDSSNWQFFGTQVARISVDLIAFLSY